MKARIVDTSGTYEPLSKPQRRIVHVRATAPARKVKGMLWLDTASNPILKTWDGSAWQPVEENNTPDPTTSYRMILSDAIGPNWVEARLTDLVQQATVSGSDKVMVQDATGGNLEYADIEDLPFVPSASMIGARLTADDSITSDTSYTAIGDLTLTIPASQTWVIRWGIFWDSHATPDIKFRVVNSGTALSDGRWGTLGIDGVNGYSTTDFSTGGIIVSYFGSGDKTIMLEALVVTAAGDATIELRFAQRTSSTNATTVYENSNVIAWRIA